MNLRWFALRSYSADDEAAAAPEAADVSRSCCGVMIIVVATWKLYVCKNETTSNAPSIISKMAVFWLELEASYLVVRLALIP